MPRDSTNDTKNLSTGTGEFGDSSPNIESPSPEHRTCSLLPSRKQRETLIFFSSWRTIASGCANSQMPKKQYRQWDSCPPHVTDFDIYFVGRATNHHEYSIPRPYMHPFTLFICLFSPTLTGPSKKTSRTCFFLHVSPQHAVRF